MSAEVGGVVSSKAQAKNMELTSYQTSTRVVDS
jgi:hypothetical protein